MLMAFSLATALADTASVNPKEAANVASENEINSLSEKDIAAKIIENFSVSIAANYETEFIFRGKKLAGSTVSPAVDISYDLGQGFGIYAGWWACYSADSEGYEENDIYAGITYSIKNFTIDLGYIAYLYPTYNANPSTENEAKIMISYDTSEFLGDYNVSPYLAFYYNFTCSGTTLEAGLSYVAPVSKWLIGENWACIDMKVYYGWNDIAGYDVPLHNAYGYAGFEINGVLSITEYFSVSVGMRYAYCNDYTYQDPTASRLWMGSSVSIGF